MLRGVPNRLMLKDNRAKKVRNNVLPNSAQAIQMFEANGGHLTEDSSFGIDPLANDMEKFQIRETVFGTKYPSFDPVFHNLVNGNDALFQNALKFFVDITYRLSAS